MTTYEPTMVQHYRAKNDVNGNPRRVFVVYAADGTILDAVDEGYAGRPIWMRNLVQLPDVTCTPTEYRTILKEFGRLSDD